MRLAGDGEFGNGMFAASFVIVCIRFDFLGPVPIFGECVDVCFEGEGGRGMFAANAVMSGAGGNGRISPVGDRGITDDTSA